MKWLTVVWAVGLLVWVIVYIVLLARAYWIGFHTEPMWAVTVRIAGIVVAILVMVVGVRRRGRP